MASGGSRVSAFLPLRLRQVDDDEVERRTAAVMTLRQQRPSGLRPAPGEPSESLAELAARIDSIEEKLDLVLELLQHTTSRELREEAVFVELHGDGLRFRSPAPLDSGATVELELTLGLMPPVDVCCLVEVIGCEPDSVGCAEAQYMVDGRFTSISEPALDEIHRYIFVTQRQARAARRRYFAGQG